MQVKYNQISPSNFRCGQIVSDNGDNQYMIEDAVNGKADLRKLPSNERVKPEYLDGSVDA